MAKSKLKKVNVGGTIWCYVVDTFETRLYKPGRKEILIRIQNQSVMNLAHVVTNDTMAKYIKENILWEV